MLVILWDNLHDLPLNERPTIYDAQKRKSEILKNSLTDLIILIDSKMADGNFLRGEKNAICNAD
jgi:hypothetical protein